MEMSGMENFGIILTSYSQDFSEPFQIYIWKSCFQKQLLICKYILYHMGVK